MSISIFARLNHRFGKPVDRAARRRFLAVTAAATGATLLSGLPAAQAQRVGAGRRVLIVGAGFAGLAAAYELKSVGYDVTLIDVRERVSGRVLSFNEQLKQPFIAGKNVEGGGELIGSNHAHWVHYADKFGLEFLDLSVLELE
ncbi:FAD-dependent oxidoreductase, partial [bacterium]